MGTFSVEQNGFLKEKRNQRNKHDNIAKFKIPNELIINWDQMAVNFNSLRRMDYARKR